MPGTTLDLGAISSDSVERRPSRGEQWPYDV